jgi:DNA-directed RNA polymerase beta subunit
LSKKNQLNTLATLRQISATSIDTGKQSERAAEMRRVHMSTLGFVCVIHSPCEGEGVGIKKQYALFATLAPPSSSEVLRKMLYEDSEVIREGLLIPLEIYRGRYARTYVNGYLIGYTKNSIELINKYRKMRRGLEINPYTTIYWDNTQNEIHFFVDVGRICRPVMIVYNNQRDPVVPFNRLNGISDIYINYIQKSNYIQLYK